MKMENIVILRSPFLLQKEGEFANADAYKHSHHKEGIATVTNGLNDLRVPYSILDEDDLPFTNSKQKPSSTIIVPDLRSCPDDVLNGLISFAENGGTVYAIMDSFFYNRPDTGTPQRVIAQRITDLFQETKINFVETIGFQKAEMYFPNSRFSWLTNGLSSPYPYSANNMLAVTAFGNLPAVHGEILCIETIKFDEKTKPVRKENRFPAFLIREFASGGLFIYACFNFRKVENNKQLFRNLIVHNSPDLDVEWRSEPRVDNSSNISKGRRQIVEQKTDYIFISYRRSDSADITGRIYDRLIDRFGKEPVFKDVDSIPLGSNFKKLVDGMLAKCSVLLAVIGVDWLDAKDKGGGRRLEKTSDMVRIEIESALERGIPVIPLLVRGAEMPSEDDLPPSLRELVDQNGIDIRPDPDFHRDMDRLIRALQRYVG